MTGGKGLAGNNDASMRNLSDARLAKETSSSPGGSL